MIWHWRDLKAYLFTKASPRLDTADLGAVMLPVSDGVLASIIGEEHLPEHPHITIVVFKDIHNLPFNHEDVIDVVRSIGAREQMAFLRTAGLDWFGSEKDIPVIRVESAFVRGFRMLLIERLAERGIEVDMTFPEFKPHISITKEAADAYPAEHFKDKIVMASPVEVWWGNVHHKVN